LIRDGYDDASRSDVPLIVGYRPGAAAVTPAGATVRRALASVNGAAVATPKAQAGTFWPGAAATYDRIWLDGRSRLLDDRSNAQIGVPAAAQAGYTGKGVTVAVLDGGYDATHPDLAGGVTGARDFTGSPAGIRDEYGHGTHVASTIAGSGAASAGKYGG